MNHIITWPVSSSSNDLLIPLLQTINLAYQTIIIIEPYGSIISLIKKAKEHHLNVIILTANDGMRQIDIVAVELVDLVIHVDTLNELQLTQLVREIAEVTPVHAIIPGFEYFVTIAAHLAEILKLPGIPTHCVNNARHKDKMRHVLQEAGIKIPRFKLVENIDELSSIKYHMNFPLVCKPLDAAGSVLIKKVVNDSELIEAGHHILNHQHVLWGYKLDQRLLVEEYIEGREFSVEGIVQNDEIYIYSVTEKTVSDQCEFIEIAHQVHTPLSKAIANKIHRYCSDVVWALGLNNTPFHAECRIDCYQEPVLMEIAARLAGDKIADLLSLTSSVNYLEQVLAVYLGKPVIPPGTRNFFAGIRFFYRPYMESYSRVEIDHQLYVEQGRIHEMKYYYQPNTAIPDFPKALRRLGHVIMVDEDYDAIKESLRLMDQATYFVSS